MKKLLTVFLAAALIFSCQSCTNRKTENNKKEEQMEISHTQKHYADNSIYYDFTTDTYSFRMPLEWKPRCNVVYVGNSQEFYEANSYDKDETGLLFTISEYKDNSYTKQKNYDVLYKCEKSDSVFVMTVPEEEKYPEEFKEQYEELKKGIHIPKSTFKAFCE